MDQAKRLYQACSRFLYHGCLLVVTILALIYFLRVSFFYSVIPVLIETGDH